MKKSVFALVLCLLCVLGATCFARNPDAARLPHERMAVGELRLFDTMEHVKSLYGEPDSQKTGFSHGFESDYAIWEYSGTVKIFFVQNEEDDNFSIRHLSVTADNGFATPDGIKVGMDAAVLTETYGEPILHRHSKKGIETYQYDNDRAEYLHLLFQVVDGRITEIALHYDI